MEEHSLRHCVWSWYSPVSQAATHCLPLSSNDPPHAVHSKLFSQVTQDGWQADRCRERKWETAKDNKLGLNTIGDYMED